MDVSESPGIVYLVGAGPGDPGLLTVRGRRLLEAAEVVVYDRLAAAGLLSYAPAGAELIDVGKAPGAHSYGQEAINRLLIEKGRSGKRVVRLKGGDPLLFGRGGEEALALREAGVAFEIVPGVSAALAAPAYAGIPVTHRGLAAGVTILTGHEMEGKAEAGRIDWPGIARCGQTLVILMGMANLRDIAAILLTQLDPETAAAIIEKGTMPEQRTVQGSLCRLVELAEAAGLGSPAVIVVGAVAGLAGTLEWVAQRRPLLGWGIVLTRPLGQSRELADAISEKGGEPLPFPTIRVEESAAVPAAELVAAVGAADWLVFTSRNGVESFFKQWVGTGRDSRGLHGKQIAAIGRATAGALLERGVRADLVPDHFTSEQLLQSLSPYVRERAVLLPRVQDAPPALADGLRAGGASVTELPLYRVVTETRHAAAIRTRLERRAVQAVCLTSPSTVRGLLENIGGDLRLLDEVRLVCIGPVTAAFAAEQGLKIAGVAANSGVPEMLECLMGLAKQSNRCF